MNQNKKSIMQILLITTCLLISFLSCKNPQENPEEISRMSRFEQMSDSELTETDSLGKTFLHHAAVKSDTALMTYLLKRGLAVDQKDNSGLTPLHDAVRAQDAAAIRFLIDHQADVRAKTADLDTPLHLAVFNNDIHLAEMLFFCGAHSDALTENKDKVSPFSHAVKNRYYAMAELLYFPMHYIIKRNKTEYYDYLVQNKEDAVSQTDMRKMIPLHVAHLFQNQYFIDRLSESGADNNALDVYGRKSSDYATMDFLEPAKANRLDNSTRIKVDDKVFDFLLHYKWMAVGIIQDGEIAYLRSFGKKNMLEKDAVYASVSKPVTSVIFVLLLKQGLIRNLDDSIFDYSKKYGQDVMPEQYAGANLTFRHLLTHQSGIPHINKPLWKDGKLNLQFQPGTKTEYSTNGFAVLGEILEEITGKSYSDLVKEYVGKPVQASSFWAEGTFRAPGARVHSTPEDFARFAQGVINHTYMSERDFTNILAKDYGESALGWGGSDWDTDDFVMGHAGSNGKPRAYILIKPKKKLGVVLMGEANSTKEDIWFLNLGSILMDIIDRGKSY
ncbi:MAG: serine hydrolase [Candidatus Aminicenantes bacterium]|nr:MAG: serine hydrolase [Candidatus Aminicenantes bacterium]